MPEVDEVDKSILAILKRDSRTNFTEIARMLNLSEGAVRHRVKSLVDRGIIKSFTIEIAKDYNVRAVTFVSVSPSTPTPTVADRLAQISGVTEVYEVTGSTDIMAFIAVDSMPMLNKVIEEIRNIPGIVETNTSIILRHVRSPNV